MGLGRDCPLVVIEVGAVAGEEIVVTVAPLPKVERRVEAKQAGGWVPPLPVKTRRDESPQSISSRQWQDGTLGLSPSHPFGRGVWESLMDVLACARTIGSGRLVRGRRFVQRVLVVDGRECLFRLYRYCCSCLGDYCFVVVLLMEDRLRNLQSIREMVRGRACVV